MRIDKPGYYKTQEGGTAYIVKDPYKNKETDKRCILIYGVIECGSVQHWIKESGAFLANGTKHELDLVEYLGEKLPMPTIIPIIGNYYEITVSCVQSVFLYLGDNLFNRTGYYFMGKNRHIEKFKDLSRIETHLGSEFNENR